MWNNSLNHHFSIKSDETSAIFIFLHVLRDTADPIHPRTENNLPSLEFLRSSKENMAETKGGKKIPHPIEERLGGRRCVKLFWIPFYMESENDTLE